MNMVKLPSQWRMFSRMSLAILLAISGLASAETIPANCQALIEMRNDLWFVKPDTSPPFQLTHDGSQKFSVGGVSPDGKMIAYVDEPTDDVMLVDLTGKLLSRTNLHTQQAIVGVKWLNTNLLQIAEHISPTNAGFHFMEIPAGGLHPVPLQGLPSVFGDSCTPSPSRRKMACNGAGSVELNDEDIYFTTDAFVSAIELQALDVAVGSAATTATVPPFKVEVPSVADGAIELTVTAPDGQAESQFREPGNTMSLSIASDTSDEAPPTVYGFNVTIKHPDAEPSKAEDAAKGKGDKKPAIVTVRVLKSVTGVYSIEGDLAWSPDGSRIAAVEKNDLGQRWLVLINSKASASKDGARGEDRDTDGNIDAREPLPIKDPISRIDFTSDTHIKVEGETQLFEQDIPAHGKLRDAAKYTLSPALPKQFSIDNIFVPIYGWVCQ